jgi:hypothetical protein
MGGERKKIDRLWASQIAEAPDATGRAQVLADEKEMIKKSKSVQNKKRSNNPLGRPRNVLQDVFDDHY